MGGQDAGAGLAHGGVWDVDSRTELYARATYRGAYKSMTPIMLPTMLTPVRADEAADWALRPAAVAKPSTTEDMTYGDTRLNQGNSSCAKDSTQD